MTTVTTVKLQRRTKAALDMLKSERETYDQVIGKLVSQAREKAVKSELVEAYKSLGRDELELLKDWEAASSEL